MSEYIQQGDAPYFPGETKIIYLKRTTNGSEQLLILTKTQKREKRKKK